MSCGFLNVIAFAIGSIVKVAIKKVNSEHAKREPY